VQLAAAGFCLALAAAPAAVAQDGALAGQLTTLKDIHNALRKCWIWPSELDSSGNMDLTIRLSFRANGDIFGGRITHVSRAVSDNERAFYYAALQGMIGRCSHLPVSESLGRAIAGQPFIFRIVDTRGQKGA
jgi:hypothetical protein